MNAILVDVDGVLNPDFRGTWDGNEGKSLRAAGWVVLGDFTMNGRPIWLNRNHGIKLMHAAIAAHSDLVWATRWHELAGQVISPLLGLPGMEVVRFDPAEEKAWTIHHWAAGRPYAWLDDETEDQDTGTALHVHVDEHAGLGDDHIARARDWLRTRIPAA